MPKLKTPPEEIQNHTIIANIKYGMEMTGVTTEELALTMRTSMKTVYARFKRPETFRLQELRAVSRKLHISLSTLLGESVGTGAKAS